MEAPATNGSTWDAGWSLPSCGTGASGMSTTSSARISNWIMSVDSSGFLATWQLAEQIAVRGQDVLSPGSCRLTILNPAPAEGLHQVVYSRSGTSLNNQSIVSRLQCGVQSILFSADVEKEGLR